MSAAWLKNGVNTIFFTLPNEAVYNYKIKNLKIFTKAKSGNHIIELKNIIAFKNDNKNIYLNGFINLPSQLENSDTSKKLALNIFASTLLYINL